MILKVLNNNKSSFLKFYLSLLINLIKNNHSKITLKNNK